MKNVMIRSLIALAVVAAAYGDTEIREERPFGENGEVEVEVTSGSVTVEAWTEPDIQVTGKIGGSREFFQFDVSDNKATIRVKNPKGSRGNASGDLVVLVPHRCKEVRVWVTSADVVVRGIVGDVRVAAVSGDVNVLAAKGDVRAETVSGDLTVEGDIQDSEVKSVSGDVRVKTVRGDVRGNTISGKLVFEGDAVAAVKGETISGDLSYSGTVGPDADIELKAHSGDVTLAVPADVSGDFEVKCFSGDIRNGLSGDKPTYPRGPGSSLDMSLGDGAANIEVETFSGDVNLKTL